MSEIDNTEHKSSQNVVIGVIVLVAIIILLALLGPKSANDVDHTEEGNIEESHELVESENEESHESASNFGYLLPEDWDGLERAEKNIQSLAEDQVIVPGIVADPTDENIVYFASTTYDAEKKENLVSVYKYQLDDYNFERVFRKTYEPGDFSELKETDIALFQLLAYDNNSLIIKVSPINALTMEECGPTMFCDVVPRSEIVKMSLEDPYNKLEKYELPE